MISIIIPIYNRAHLIEETIKSIKAQTYTDWECILVDDNSTDNTVQIIKDIIKKDKRFYIYNRPNTLPKGANSCRNYGFELSKGKYIQFFDSDDIMLQECLKNRVINLEKENLDFVVFGINNIVGEKILKNQSLFLTNSQEEALDKFIESMIIPWNLQRTLFKRSVLENKKIFNTKLQRFQDVEFNIHLLLTRKLSFKMINLVDCNYRTAGAENPRQASFYNDVFLSIPEYFNSITSNISNEILLKNKTNLQKWLYHITALYTRKEVDIILFTKALKAGKKYIGLSNKQSIILKILFKIKRSQKEFRGKPRLLKFLKSIY